MNAYPIVFDVERPTVMSRAHVFLRLLLVILLSYVIGADGGLGLIYLGVPIAASIFIAGMGGKRYVAQSGGRMSRWLAIVVGLLAYFAFLTDDLPSDDTSDRLLIESSGSPTVTSALMRLVRAIPSALVVGLLIIVSAIVGSVIALSILMLGRCPKGCWRFQLGVVRWGARLLGYLASVVEPYPPFSFDTRSAH
jgi:hypothetical protein